MGVRDTRELIGCMFWLSEILGYKLLVEVAAIPVEQTSDTFFCPKLCNFVFSLTSSSLVHFKGVLIS